MSRMMDKTASLVDKIGRILVEPSESITDIRERHNARLSAIVSLALILVFSFYMAFQRSPTSTDLISYIMLIGIYVFSRTKLQSIAIWLLMLMIPSNTFINIGLGTTRNPDHTLYFLTLSYGLATIFLKRLWTVFFTVANVIALSLVTNFAPEGLVSREDIGVHLTINIILGIVAIVSNTHKENIEKEREIENRRNNAAALYSLTRALEVRHKETAGHSVRALDLTVELAKRCGINDKAHLRQIREGALLHDIGKIAIPDNILMKPGPLTDEEWEIVKIHPEVGYELMREFDFLRGSLAIPHYHHERYDGSGYPEGLAGDEIPIEARIFAIVDVYDALMEDRPYRDALPIGEVIEHFEHNKGVLYDPVILDEFMVLIKDQRPLTDPA